MSNVPSNYFPLCAAIKVPRALQLRLHALKTSNKLVSSLNGSKGTKTVTTYIAAKWKTLRKVGVNCCICVLN